MIIIIIIIIIIIVVVVVAKSARYSNVGLSTLETLNADLTVVHDISIHIPK